MTEERKVAFLGTSPTHEIGPYDDPSWEHIWGCSPVTMATKRWTAWFETHNPLTWEVPDSQQLQQYYADLKAAPENGQEVFALFENPEGWPGATILDWKGYALKFGGRWITSTPAWMFAHALSQDPLPTHIGLWGIDMEVGGEYEHQREGILHFIDLARRHLGVNIVMPGGSGLLTELKPYPLNMEERGYSQLEARRSFLANLGRAAGVQEDHHREVRLRAEGGAEALEWARDNTTR